MDRKIELYPLCKTQKILLFEQSYGSDPEGAAEDNIISAYVFVNKDFDPDSMEKAFTELIRVNDALRIGLVKKGLRTYQYFKDSDIYIPDRLVCAGREEFERKKKEVLGTKLPLFGDFLYRASIIDCGGGTGGMIMRFHHLICDGYSLGIIFRQIDSFYKAFSRDEKPTVQALYSFRNYIETEKKYLSSEQYVRDKKWCHKKYNTQRNFKFPTGRGGGKGDCRFIDLNIADKKYADIIDFCKAAGCSLQSVFMSLAALTVRIITSAENFSICSLFHGRTSIPLRRTVGCILSNFYVYYDLRIEASLSDYISGAYMEYLDSLSHGRVPPVNQVAFPYIQTVKNFFNYNYVWLEFSAMDFESVVDGLSIEAGSIKPAKSRYQMYCAVLDVPGKHVNINLGYQPATIPDDKATLAVEIFSECLDNLLTDPCIKVYDLINKIRRIYNERI